MGHPYAAVESFTIIIDRSGHATGVLEERSGDAGPTTAFRTDDAAISVLIDPRNSSDRGAPAIDLLGGGCVLGDGQDAESARPFVGNGVVFRASIDSRELEVFTSISGLPGVFLYRDPRVTILASSVRGIAGVPGVRLSFDRRGLRDFATVGRPLQHRTLFENLSIVPAGTRLTLSRDGELRQVGTWEAPPGEPFSDWSEYIEAQVAALRAAMSRLDLSRSFLSLTAGLDTRTIFALLTQGGASVPAFTMSGRRPTLDALRARQLSQAYGVSHETVAIDRRYVEDIPRLAPEASLLSGGLASLSQAFEVYFYESIPGDLAARISGNLGNQIGRSGTEGMSLRNASLELLASELRAQDETGAAQHWISEAPTENDQARALFLIQNENLHASLGNYCIGSHFALQQTPYADRTVIGQKLRQPLLPWTSNSTLRVRLRDLRHRVLGAPAVHSFQRRAVCDVGGFVSSCPINWGWRARGGVSPIGLLYGSMALLDVVVASRFGPLGRKIMDTVGVLGFSSFQVDDPLRESTVREFVADTLLSAGNILDKKSVRQLVDSGFRDKGWRRDLEFSLDVALAERNFLS